MAVGKPPGAPGRLCRWTLPANATNDRPEPASLPDPPRVTWSFALVSACLFLFPGFCCLAGFVYAGRIERLSAVPDIAPQSTTSFVLVIGGAIFAHLAGSGLFFAQERICGWTGQCWPLAFDPNIYKALIARDMSFAQSDAAIFLTLAGLVTLGLGTAALSMRIGQSDEAQAFFRPGSAIWLRDIARLASDSEVLVLAYVMGKPGHDGVFAAYEGIVETLSPGANGQVSNIVLSDVDRFTVRVGKRGMERNSEMSDPIPYLQIDQADLFNIGFNIVRLVSDDEGDEQASAI